MITAALFAAIMTLFVKLATQSISVKYVLFFRFLISWIICFGYIVYQKRQKSHVSYKSCQKKYQLIRAVVGSLSLSAFFHATQSLSLANANILFATLPFFIPIWSFLILKKNFSTRLIIPMLIGFIGMIILLQPNEAIFISASFWAFISGIGSALVSVLSRMVSTTDDPLCTTFWDFSVGCIFSLMLIIFGHQSVQLWSLPILYLLGVGLSGYCYLYFTVKSAQVAPVRLTGPFIYFATFFALIIDSIFWHHQPHPIEWLGMSLITMSGVSLYYLYNIND